MHTIFKVSNKNSHFGIGIKQQNKQTPITVDGVIFCCIWRNIVAY